MDFTFDYKKNLQALSGYRIANPKPLDARTVVNTRKDIAEFASVLYPGLLVYVIAEKKFIVFMVLIGKTSRVHHPLLMILQSLKFRVT